jgi:O-antigen ligase
MNLAERIAWALVWLFVFSIPWEKSVMLEGFGTFSRALGICAFAAGAVAAAQRRALRRPNLILVWAALLTAWVGATWFWSLDPPATVRRTITFLQLFGMLWLIWDLCRGPARQLQLMHAYVWGSVAGAVSGFARYAAGRQTYYGRYAAEGFEPNDFGVVMALGIPMTSYLARRTKGWKAALMYAAVAVQTSAVLLTASRTALIATFLGFGFLLFTLGNTSRRHKAAVCALAAFLALSLVRLAPPSSRKRLATIPREVTSGTLNDRTQIWKAGVKVFPSHALAGVGAGAYPEAVRPWLGVPTVPGAQNVAHNTFLSVLVECGVIGFGLFALLLGSVLLYVWQMGRVERLLWATMLLVWCAGVSTLTWEHYKPTWLLFALASTEWARSWWKAERA